MSDLNSYILGKMGWIKYDSFFGIGAIARVKSVFNEEPLIKYHILDSDRKICFVIKHLSGKEKLKTKKLYKFIIIQNYDDPEKLLDESLFKILNFSSNEELFKLIIEWEACNPAYQRHFRINKILKK